MLSTADYFAGVLWLAVVLGSALTVGLVAQRRWWRDLERAEAALAVATLASCSLAVDCLVPGVLTVLSPLSVLLAACLSAVAALVLWRGQTETGTPSREEPAQSPPSPGWSWGLALVAVGAVGVATVAFLLDRSRERVVGVDALAFQLPTVVRWIQSGSLWTGTQLEVDLSNGAYPHNGNLMHLVPMLAWRSSWAARYVDVPFFLLSGLGVYALARRLRAPASTACLAAAALLTMTAVSLPALLAAQVDPPFLAWFTAGALFLLRWSQTGRGRDLVLAGVGLGLSLGTKWYALPDVPIVLIACGIGLLVARRRFWPVAVPLLKVAALCGLLGGFWLVRNWVTFGNPFHPSALRVAGVTVFDAAPDPNRSLAGWSISEYLFDGGIWREYFVPAFYLRFGFVGPLFALGAVAAAVVAVRRLRTQPRSSLGPILTVFGASVVIGIVYLKLPFTALGPHGKPAATAANTRYLVPALVGFAALSAWFAGQAGRLRAPAEAGLLVAALLALHRTCEGTGTGCPGPSGLLAAAGLLLLAVASGLAAVRIARLLPEGRRRALVGVGVAAVAGVGGLVVERRATSAAYGDLDATIAWIESRAPAGARIGLLGAFSPGALEPELPAFGPRLDNHVSYVGRIERGTPRDVRSEAEFRRLVADRRYDLILVGLTPKLDTGGPGTAGYTGWTQAAGYTPVARTRTAILFAGRSGARPDPG